MPDRLVRLIACLAPATAPDEGKWAGLLGRARLQHMRGARLAAGQVR
jgi:hypothetical protein